MPDELDPARMTFPTRREAQLAAHQGETATECGYCQRWFLPTRSALTCGPSCRKALSRARYRKQYLRASHPAPRGDAAPTSACTSAEERAMRDLRARLVKPGPSRWGR